MQERMQERMQKEAVTVAKTSLYSWRRLAAGLGETRSARMERRAVSESTKSNVDEGVCAPPPHAARARRHAPGGHLNEAASRLLRRRWESFRRRFSGRHPLPAGPTGPTGPTARCGHRRMTNSTKTCGGRRSLYERKTPTGQAVVRENVAC